MTPPCNAAFALGPTTNVLYRDVYGCGFAATAVNAPDALPWGTVWQTRSRTEWEGLASTWGFTHVVAPTNQALDLSRVLVRDDYTLYAIRK